MANEQQKDAVYVALKAAGERRKAAALRRIDAEKAGAAAGQEEQIAEAERTYWQQQLEAIQAQERAAGLGVLLEMAKAGLPRPEPPEGQKKFAYFYPENLEFWIAEAREGRTHQEEAARGLAELKAAAPQWFAEQEAQPESLAISAEVEK